MRFQRPGFLPSYSSLRRGSFCGLRRELRRALNGVRCALQRLQTCRSGWRRNTCSVGSAELRSVHLRSELLSPHGKVRAIGRGWSLFLAMRTPRVQANLRATHKLAQMARRICRVPLIRNVGP